VRAVADRYPRRSGTAALPRIRKESQWVLGADYHPAGVIGRAPGAAQGILLMDRHAVGQTTCRRHGLPGFQVVRFAPTTFVPITLFSFEIYRRILAKVNTPTQRSNGQ